MEMCPKIYGYLRDPGSEYVDEIFLIYIQKAHQFAFRLEIFPLYFSQFQVNFQEKQNPHLVL